MNSTQPTFINITLDLGQATIIDTAVVTKTKIPENQWDPKRDGQEFIPEQKLQSERSIFDKDWNFVPAQTIRAYIKYHDDYGEKKKRNDTIENIRDQFLNEAKERKHSFENKGDYLYKSDYHRDLFLEIVEALGFSKKAEVVEENNDVYDFVDGFCHKVSMPREKLEAKHWISKIELSNIKKMQLTELGGMEEF